VAPKYFHDTLKFTSYTLSNQRPRSSSRLSLLRPSVSFLSLGVFLCFLINDEPASSFEWTTKGTPPVRSSSSNPLSLSPLLHFPYLGASIPLGNEAEIFIIVILWGNLRFYCGNFLIWGEVNV